jgi:hypothetical protein
MAVIHDTTMSPGKLELLAAWLPAQPWYLDGGRAPILAKAGGSRVRGILATADYTPAPGP